MIERLIIKNYLVIKNAELEFTEGLNILTGETGAGKSIILDSLSLILGERADYSIIKNDKDKLIVEGHFEFDNKRINRFLNSHSLDLYENHGKTKVIIRRELNKKGVSRNFINDTPVSAGDLKEFGDLIVDIHSQNEHQSLLNKETHIYVLDEYMSEDKLLSDYREEFRKYKSLVEQLIDTLKKKDELTEKRTYIEFQLREINNVNPSENEYENIESTLSKLENTEEISSAINEALRLLKNDENNISAAFSQAIRALRRIEKYDSELSVNADELENAFITVKEISNSLEAFAGSLHFDPETTENLRDRLGQLSFLKKRFNLSINELIQKAKSLEDELNLADNFDFEIDKIRKECAEQKNHVISLAEKLSEERKNAAKKLSKEVNKYLKEVGFENASFSVNFDFLTRNNDEYFSNLKSGTNIGFNKNGCDVTEFMIITNKGDTYHPLRKIVSGGEISRIMLAIKASLSLKDDIPILVFDEIDAGISGRVAQKVGKVLKKLSETHQLICITHLAQIAAISDNHFSVSKHSDNKETMTEIRKIQGEEKVMEIAKLLSGDKISDNAINNARELIQS